MSTPAQNKHHFEALHRLQMEGITPSSREFGRRYRLMFEALCIGPQAEAHKEAQRRLKLKGTDTSTPEFLNAYKRELGAVNAERGPSVAPVAAIRTNHAPKLTAAPSADRPFKNMSDRELRMAIDMVDKIRKRTASTSPSRRPDGPKRAA